MIAANATVRTPPRRTQVERTAAARRKIIAAAQACIAELGYYATSMSDIATAAGVSTGLLHYHFDNKDQLALAVWDDMAQRMVVRIATQAKGMKPSRESLSRIIDAIVAQLGESKVLAPIIVDLAVRSLSNPDTKALFRAMVDREVGKLQQVIAAFAGPAASRRQVEIRPLADTFFVMCGGWAIAMSLDDRTDSPRLKEFFAEFKTLLMNRLYPLQTK